MTWRTEAMEKFPGVVRLKKPRQCDDYRWSRMSLKAYRERREDYRCKKPAYWKFTALKRSDAKSGMYCWPHLLNTIYYNPDEERRFNRWWAKNKHLKPRKVADDR